MYRAFPLVLGILIDYKEELQSSAVERVYGESLRVSGPLQAQAA